MHHVFVIPKHRACFCLIVAMIFSILTSNIVVFLDIKSCSFKNKQKKSNNFPGGPVVRNLLSNAGDLGLIHGQELRLHISWGN